MDFYSIFVKLVPSVITAGILFFILYLFRKEAAADGKTGNKFLAGKRFRYITASAAFVTIAGCLVSSIIDNDTAYLCFLIGPVLIVSVLLLAQSKAGRFVAVLLVFFLALGIYLVQSPVFRQAQGDLDITLTDAAIEISGSFGEDIPLEDIKTLKIVDNLPGINLRTFGYSAAGVNRGRFRTKSGRTVWLYTYSSDQPAIRIDTNDGREIYINSRDSLRTIAVYNRIDSLMQTMRQ